MASLATGRSPVKPTATETLDRYQNLHLIGEGALSEVFSAWDSSAGERVAVKLMRSELTGTPGSVERFEREASFLAAVAGPNVLRVRSFGLAGGRPFLVADLALGTVQSRLPAHPRVEPDAVRRLIGDLAAGIGTAHLRGECFLDICPRNLLVLADRPLPPGRLLDRSERVVLSDPSFSLRAGETGTGPWMEYGTPRFAAPEQRVGTFDRTPAMDIYGATATLWTVLRRSRPPHPEAVPAAGGDRAPSLARFFAVGMAAKAGRRYPTITDWHHAAVDAISCCPATTDDVTR